MKKPLLSIIVPVYNCSKWLRRCLDSILAQKIQNFECIIVDDCSTDDSLDIMQSYALKDKRFIVLHNSSNIGPALSRNLALSLIKGKWFTFVDGDDYIDENRYSLPLEYSFNQDMIRCAICEISDGLKFRDKVFGNISKTAFSTTDMSTSTNIIFRSSKLKNIRFPNCQAREDTMFNMLCYAKTTKIFSLDLPLYYYDRHQNSLACQKTAQKVITGFVEQFKNNILNSNLSIELKKRYILYFSRRQELKTIMLELLNTLNV